MDREEHSPTDARYDSRESEMKRIGLIIFALGVLIDTGAFLMSNTDHFAFVYPIISASYSKGLAAINMIEDKGEIRPGTPEFEICNDLYMESIKHDNPNQDFSGITILRFHHPPKVSQGFSVKKGVTVRRPLDVYLSNDLKYESTIEALQIKVDRLKASRIFRSSTLLFIIGIMLTVLGFAMEYLKKKDA